MKTYGGSGRGARWYGSNEGAIVAGRLASELEILPAHEPARAEPEPAPVRKRRRTRRRLNSRRAERERQKEWELANGIWTDEQ